MSENQTKDANFMRHITITAANISLSAELNDSPTADAIWNALPITGSANTWGDEIYFRIPVKMKEDAHARAEVAVGELGYWPPGNAFCIFFGRTPASTNEQPRAASPVNIIGRVLGDATQCRKVNDGATVRLERT
jgi:hypothetical protein